MRSARALTVDNQPCPIGAVTEGQFLKRTGNTIVGATGGGGADWGSIGGTLSAQTDLQGALDGKTTLVAVKADADIASAISLKHSNSQDHSNSLDHDGGSQDTAIAARELSANKGAASGYCGLNASQKVAIANIPTGATVNDVCIGNDARLSDARTPLSHNQDASTINAGMFDGDRLPSVTASKRGGVPATGAPSGKVLSDYDTWIVPTAAPSPDGFAFAWFI